MISVDVRKKLGTFVVEVSFASDGARVVALCGPSGSGKTSIINMVAGLVRPDRGRIDVNGRCMFDSERRINVPPEKRRFGYIFQDGRLFPHLSVATNLTYGMRLIPRSQRRVRYDQVVEVLGIGHLLDRRPGKLSGGEKQRVAIGRALLTSPELLLMDEPLASLDSRRKAELLPFIGRLPDEFGTPILYVSHSAEEIHALADTTMRIENGRPVMPDCAESARSERSPGPVPLVSSCLGA